MLLPTRPPARPPAGFAIFEIVIVLLIGTALLTALLRFLVAGHPLAKVTYFQAQSTETARVQLKRLAKSLRELRLSDTGAYPLVSVDPQRIIFYSNVDADPLTERLRYELVGTDLERGIVEPSGDPLTYNLDQEDTTIVASTIRNGTTPIFTYYTGSYPADPIPLTPTDLTEVKYIQFNLIVDADPDADPAPVSVVSQVQLRNLKTNLGEEGE